MWIRSAGVACLAAAIGSPAEAQITGTSGAVRETTAPPSVLLGAIESNQDIVAYLEKSFILPIDLQVDVSTPSIYDGLEDMTPFVIPAGSAISSYLLHLDPFSNMDAIVSGSVTFAGEILGIIVSNASLDATDNLLGSPATIYPTGQAWRGIDAPWDMLTLSSDMHTLTIDQFWANGAVDQIRVVTVGTVAPEPAVIGLLGLAAAVRRRRPRDRR